MISLALLVGPIVPLPAPELVPRLARVEVNRSDQAPNGFQLAFNVDKTPLGRLEILDNPLLADFNRVILVLIDEVVPIVLMDGYITSTELVSGADGGGMQYVVTGEDVSVKMDLFSNSESYPFMPVPVIIEMILAKYATLGVVPEVIPPPYFEAPLEETPQQVGTDLEFLRNLATAYGYVFYIEPGPVPFVNTAYWGPQDRLHVPGPALSVSTGPISNVEQLEAKYDALAPTLIYGMAFPPEVPVPAPFVGVPTGGLPPFALEPAPLALYAALGLMPESSESVLPVLDVRGQQMRFDDPLDVMDATARATGMTAKSQAETLVLEGEVNTGRYGAVMGAPGIVGVQGAGLPFDGMYYVQQVHHTIDFTGGSIDYRQQFRLTRDGRYPTTPVVPNLPEM